MQKSQGATSRRRPLRVVSVNRTPHPSASCRRKPAPTPARPSAAAARHFAPPAAAARLFAPEASAARPPAADAASPSESASAGAALDRLLLARSDISGIVSQIDELVSTALQHQTISKRGKQELESFNCFLSDTNSSLKQWSSRLKQALEASPEKSKSVAKGTTGTCSVWEEDDKLLCTGSKLPETDLIVSPSPLVSWRAGSCMVDNGRQLFLLTPLTKTKPCSSRCPKSSEIQSTAAAGMDKLNHQNLPVWKLTIADEGHPDQEQSKKANEPRTGAVTPLFVKAKTGSSEDSLFPTFSFSVQKTGRSLPSPCLKTALSGKQKQLFSPISEGSRKEDIHSIGASESDKPSEGSGHSFDEISKDLASRYPNFYGFNESTTREADDDLDWFLSPLKTCVLMNPSDDKPSPTPARDVKSRADTPWKSLESDNLKSRQELLDDNKTIQTPAVHSKALLGTPWKGLESTNMKGRKAGETTLKRELWTRFEAVSTNELHFDKSLFPRSDGKRFLDILEEAS